MSKATSTPHITPARLKRALARIEAAAKLHEQGDLAAAVAQYQAALIDAPHFAPGHMVLGLALAALRHYDEAEASLEHALRLDPTLADAHLGVGKLRLLAEDVDGAIAAFQQALLHDPKSIPTLCEWWTVAEKLGRTAECVMVGRRYVALRPEHREARWDLALQELAAGHLAAGWEGYAERWSHKVYRTWRFDLPAAEWNGEDLRGKRILAWREQGIGDEIMFASCLPDLIDRAGEVTFACTDRLLSLFARSFPSARVIDVKRITPPSVEDFAIDYHTALGALPRWLRPSIESFPTKASFLVPEPTLRERWRERLAALPSGLRVGISWRSGLMTENRARSYTTLDQWGPLLQTPGVHFVNLQYDDCELALATAEDQFGVHINSFPGLDLRNDLESTAALIANLDLVITIGNAVGELSGALGVPTWRLSPSPIPEWTMLGTGRRPWFPMMRVCQAPSPGDWKGLLETLASDLHRLSAGGITLAAA